MTRLTCQDLDVSIAGIPVVRALDLEFKPGQFWGLLGSNGIGKTTLLRCLAGLIAPGGGAVVLDSEPIDNMSRRDVAQKLGMLQQHTVYLFDASALQIALTGRHPHLSRWDREGEKERNLAEKALGQVGLDGFSDREVTSLSGGEARRLAFASLLVQDPGIMLLDEPTNHLDLRHQLQIMNIAAGQAANYGKAVVSALHDVNLAARYCTHILMLFGDGKWQAGTCAEMLDGKTLERLYGCRVEAINTESGPRFHPLGEASPGSS